MAANRKSESKIINVPKDGAVRKYQLYVDGEWIDPAKKESISSINPYTGKVWAEFANAGAEDVDAAVTAARRALEGNEWHQCSGSARAKLMLRLADLIDDNAEALATIESLDNGKLYKEMLGQVKGLSDYYRYFAGWADKLFGKSIPIDNPDFLVYTRSEPIGVVAAVTAWNSPLLLLTYKLAPALATGCTFVLKPAEQASASALEFARLVSEAGFPCGVFNIITGSGSDSGAALVSHSGIDKVAFTGSTATGREVVKASAEYLPRLSLELGGKSPNIVFPDADVDAATNGIVAGIFAASGQSCVAGSRLLIHDSLHDEVVDRLVERASRIRLGDPFESATEMGPLAFKEQYDRVIDYLDVAERNGARIAFGGKSNMDGLFVQPTILCDVTNDMRVCREEIFGPVLSVLRFSSDDQAVRLANDSPFGLAAGLWTEDIRRAHTIANQLRAGTVWVNAYRSLHRGVPFGGFGLSGHGRENGPDVLAEYLQSKSIWVELGGVSRDPFVMG